MVNVGEHLATFLGWFLQDAGPECKCHARANLLNVLGPRWTRDNLETVIDWLIEEAEQRGISPVDAPRGRWFAKLARAGQVKAERAFCSQIILMACRQAERAHRRALRVPG